MQTYTFHADPGHGWIEVPKAELEALNIADKITSCSYMKGDTAYLEEDCDLSTFFRAMEAAGKPMTPACIIETYAENTPIRSYDSYRPDAFVTKDAFANLFVREELCVYKAGETGIQTVLDDTGHCKCSGKPASDYAQRGFKVMPLTKAMEHIDAALKATYSDPWTEISEEDYWDMLEILPPENYDMASGAFRMSEYMESNITGHYLRAGNRYFTAYRPTRPTWDFYLHELTLQLSE